MSTLKELKDIRAKLTGLILDVDRTLDHNKELDSYLADALGEIEKEISIRDEVVSEVFVTVTTTYKVAVKHRREEAVFAIEWAARNYVDYFQPEPECEDIETDIQDEYSTDDFDCDLIDTEV